MSDPQELEKVKGYFTEKLETHGATPKGVDYNSSESQELRFEQLIKLIDPSQKYSLLDFGSGYGGMYDYLLRIGHTLHYVGYDIAEPMVLKGRELHPANADCWFTANIDEVPVLDYAVVSGTFNMKLEADFEAWTKIVVAALHQMDRRASKGFSFNMLTKYSDAGRMRPDLYYADPLFFFDYCKRSFSKNVALLHDYKLYDFTILVRKD
ncbi:MAG: class I SAM-dependent methyltransferase [Anaerolineales bacterium]|jgi:SAM-dependent methyltransferase|nr:class I SAM-dependent methyltransferase [Anaerolineales bacterium]